MNDNIKSENSPPMNAFTATCRRCGRQYGHGGPCPRCVPHGGSCVNVAMQLAARSHDMQFRKGDDGEDCDEGINYLVHCAQIVALLDEWGFRIRRHPDLFAIAWLHDAVEENGTTIQEIATTTWLGVFIAKCVDELTCPDGMPKAEYLKRFADPQQSAIESVTVKFADRICNVRDFKKKGNPYWKKYREKGSPILQAVWDRESEIVSKAGIAMPRSDLEKKVFGENVFAKMVKSWDELLE